MRRAVARGRLVPQSLSTDPRVGQLSLKAALLFPLIWINCDDQGRISGNPNEIKYATCPNIDHITKADIPQLLKELDEQGLIKAYSTSRTKAIQMLDWWEEQKLQWAYPSKYPPPDGWQDHLRYHASPTQVIKENWPPTALPSELPSAPANALPSKLKKSPLTTLSEKGKGKRRGRGNLPSALGSRSPPSPASLSTDKIEILNRLTACFKKEWGKVPAEKPDEIIPREPTARESAQLRDLSQELSVAGCPLDYINQAFRDAAGRPGKMHVWYVRGILLDWLGVPRAPP